MFVFPSSKGRAKDICVPTLAKRGIKSVWYTNGFPGWWTKPFFCIEEPIDEVKNSLRKLKKSGFTNIFSNVLRAKLVSSSSEEYWGYSDLHLVLLGSYLWCFARAFVSFYLFFCILFCLITMKPQRDQNSKKQNYCQYCYSCP